MGLGAKRGKMWAGVMDNHIASDDKSTDEYTPISLALFRSRSEARKHYERVVEVDVDVLLHVEAKAK